MLHRLEKAPVNSLEFQPCDSTPQAECFRVYFDICTAQIEHSSFTVWTTGVSNPVCSPHLHTSASEMNCQMLSPSMFLPVSQYFTTSQEIPKTPPSLQYINSNSDSCKFQFQNFNRQFDIPPTYPLRPIKLNNARSSCLTATAGTGIGRNFLQLQKSVQSYNLQGFTNYPSSPT